MAPALGLVEIDEASISRVVYRAEAVHDSDLVDVGTTGGVSESRERFPVVQAAENFVSIGVAKEDCVCTDQNGVVRFRLGIFFHEVVNWTSSLGKNAVHPLAVSVEVGQAQGTEIRKERLIHL